MYLKVPYRREGGQSRDATVEEIQQALQEIAPNATVDMDLNYPSVEFPAGASYTAMKQALEARGFEVS